MKNTITAAVQSRLVKSETRSTGRLVLALALACFSLGSNPSAAQGTGLASVAGSMSPGSWAALNTSGISALGRGNSTGNIAPYSMSSAWDPVGKRIYFQGQDHANDTGLVFAQLDAASNTWSSAGAIPNIGSHGYDHLAIDPGTGRLFLYVFGSKDYYSYPIANGGPWSAEPPIPAQGYVNITTGVEFFPGVGLVVYICGETSGEILIRDLSGNWSRTTGFGPNGGYHCFAEYSAAANAVVFGGASLNPRKVWRLNANKTVTPLQDSPVGLGIQQANVVADPTTGNFLVLGFGQFLELDPRGSGTWRAIASTPPPAVGNPAPPSLDSIFSTSITSYGVVAYTTCRASACGVYLYKHAASTGAPIRAPVPPGGLSAL